jgi:hypothetical protein
MPKYLCDVGPCPCTASTGCQAIPVDESEGVGGGVDPDTLQDDTVVQNEAILDGFKLCSEQEDERARWRTWKGRPLWCKE